MNKVIVKVVGSQLDAAGEENSIKMMAEGRHYYRSGKHYILYDDPDLGKEKGSSTLLKVAEDSITLLRRGEVTQEQYFAKHKESTSVYRTPYGSLDLSVRTKAIDIAYGSVSGNIDIVYAMSVNGTWQSDNKLHIEICAAGTENNKLN